VAGWLAVLDSAGSALALTFIVALALGIGALTLFFFGSSVVVLQSFARQARAGGVLLCIVVLEALLLGGILVGQEDLREVLPADATPMGLWLTASATAALGSVLALSICAGLLRTLSSGRLARASLVVLAAGYGLGVGGSGRVAYAAAPALACLAAAALVAVRRRRGGARSGDVESALWLLGVVLLAGVVAALALGRPSPALAEAGGWVLLLFAGLVVLGLLPLAAAGFLEMRHSAEWFIASRYLVAQRRQTFISIISVICAAGVAAGVWLIITVLSVMNGFQEVWREEFVGKRAHLTVMSRYGNFADYREAVDKVLATPEVMGASPFLDAEGMVRGERGQIQGVRVRGIDPFLVGAVSTLPDDVIAGSLEALDPQPPAEAGGEDPLPGIVIASGLAWRLGVGVGDPLLLVSPFGGPPTPFGPAPRLHRYQVAAIFQPSFAQLDEMYAYVSLNSAQAFLRVSDVAQGIEVRTRDFYRSSPVGLAVQAGLGEDYYVRDWKEFFPEFFQALKTERVMMFILLTMIMVVAAFVIVATLIMMIMEKTSDIAILKAMGASEATIERIFALEGTLIGIVGTAVGVVAGVVVTKRLPWVQRQVEAITGIDTLPASVYQGVSTLPSDIDPLQVTCVAGIAMVLALGATLLPSRQGARLEPAEALRYE